MLILNNIRLFQENNDLFHEVEEFYHNDMERILLLTDEEKILVIQNDVGRVFTEDEKSMVLEYDKARLDISGYNAYYLKGVHKIIMGLDEERIKWILNEMKASE